MDKIAFILEIIANICTILSFRPSNRSKVKQQILDFIQWANYSKTYTIKINISAKWIIRKIFLTFYNISLVIAAIGGCICFSLEMLTSVNILLATVKFLSIFLFVAIPLNIIKNITNDPNDTFSNITLS